MIIIFITKFQQQWGAGLTPQVAKRRAYKSKILPFRTGKLDLSDPVPGNPVDPSGCLEDNFLDFADCKKEDTQPILMIERIKQKPEIDFFQD